MKETVFSLSLGCWRPLIPSVLAFVTLFMVLMNVQVLFLIYRDCHCFSLSVINYLGLFAGNNLYTPKIIGLYMPPSVEYIISVLSILRIGEAFLPLDHSWPRQRTMSIISSSNVSLVIACGSSFGEPIHESHWLVKCGICPVLCFSMEQIAEETIRPSELNSAWHFESQRQRLFCYLMYTSGSTGKPKGVCGTEQGKQLELLIHFMNNTYVNS